MLSRQRQQRSGTETAGHRGGRTTHASDQARVEGFLDGPLTDPEMDPPTQREAGHLVVT